MDVLIRLVFDFVSSGIGTKKQTSFTTYEDVIFINHKNPKLIVLNDHSLQYYLII